MTSQISPEGSFQTPKCFLDLTVDGTLLGRVIVELRNDIVPKTCENFRALCTGEKGFSYKGSVFHRIIPKFYCQGGDITSFDGSGGKSIYKDSFPDENFKLKHNEPGLLSMVNSGPNTNCSQFFITLISCPWLDGKNVVFGKVIKGMEIIKKIESYGKRDGKTTAKIKIANCGQIFVF